MGTHPIFESDFDCLTGQLIWSRFGSREHSLKSRETKLNKMSYGGRGGYGGGQGYGSQQNQGYGGPPPSVNYGNGYGDAGYGGNQGMSSWGDNGSQNNMGGGYG